MTLLFSWIFRTYLLPVPTWWTYWCDPIAWSRIGPINVDYVGTSLKTAVTKTMLTCFALMSFWISSGHFNHREPNGGCGGFVALPVLISGHIWIFKWLFSESEKLRRFWLRPRNLPSGFVFRRGRRSEPANKTQRRLMFGSCSAGQGQQNANLHDRAEG